MDVIELRTRRTKLEQELKGIISAKLDAFREETGMPVKGVYIALLDVTSFTDSEPRYLIGEVSCSIEI